MGEKGNIVDVVASLKDMATTQSSQGLHDRIMKVVDDIQSIQTVMPKGGEEAEEAAEVSEAPPAADGTEPATP